jgi:glycosyltransferase involved in cell wall biosynthesis
MSGIRRISTMHSSYRLEHGGSAKGYAYEQVIRLNQLLRCRFIAVSEAVTRYLQEMVHLPAERVQLIVNSIRIPPTAHPRTHALYQQMGWDERHHKLIVVGRLEEVKGHSYLIDALHQLTAAYPMLRCLLVGEGRCKEALLAQVEALGLQQVIHFSGFRDDVDTLLAASDLFAMPSLSEGLPYALLEACAYHLPVLVSAVGGMAQLLTDRQHGRLVPAADAAALAQGLRWLLDHPAEAQQLADAAYTLIEREYGLQTMLDRTLALYQS